MSRQPNTKEKILETLKSNTVYMNDCWLYISSNKKHPQLRYDGKLVSIHRLSAHIHWGFDLASEKLICHKTNCNNKNCWNPEHIYEGTPTDNVRDTIAIGRHRSPLTEAETAKTHCIHGHEFTEENTFIDKNNKRNCRECHRERVRQRHGWSARNER